MVPNIFPEPSSEKYAADFSPQSQLKKVDDKSFPTCLVKDRQPKVCSN
jgi:hypothetical protein